MASLAIVFTAAAVLALAALSARRPRPLHPPRARRGRTLTRATGARLAHQGRATYLQAPHDLLGSSVLLPLRGDVARGLAIGH